MYVVQNDIDVTVKGSRPQPKFYTDLHCCVEGVNGCYGIGMEPSIWQAGPVGTAHPHPLGALLPKSSPCSQSMLFIYCYLAAAVGTNCKAL